MYLDVDEILDGIENAIGISLAPPAGAVPVTGLDTSRGPLHYRHFNSLYAALRIKALLPDSGAICEYVALGTFFTFSYFACQAGLTVIVVLHAKTITIRYVGGAASYYCQGERKTTNL